MSVLDSVFTANCDQLLADLRNDVNEGIEFDVDTVCGTINWISQIQLSEKPAFEIARQYTATGKHYGVDELVAVMAKAAIVGLALAVQAIQEDEQ